MVLIHRRGAIVTHSHPWDETEIDSAFTDVVIGSASRSELWEMQAVTPSSTFLMRPPQKVGTAAIGRQTVIRW